MVTSKCTYTFTIELQTSTQNWSIDQDLLYICREANACDDASPALTAPVAPIPSRVYYFWDTAMTITITFEFPSHVDCTANDIRYTYEIYDPYT
jgi:hypothetical protein